MGLDGYIFALFVFGLGALLVFFLVKGMGKNREDRDRLWEEREQKLERMYGEVTDLLEALEAYIEDNKAALGREIAQARNSLEDTGVTEPAEALPHAEETAVLIETAPVSKADMKQRAFALDRQGVPVGEIARELGLSRGEVAFMLNLSNKPR